MILADCGVYPFPEGKASLARFALELRDLGFRSMVAIGQKSCSVYGVNVFGGEYLVPASARGLGKQVAGCSAAVTLVQAGENGLNRSILTTKGVHILCGIHAAPKNAFDRFCARLAAEQKIAVDIRIAPLICLRGLQRQKVIRAYEEIEKLQRRYEFPVTISSGARSITDIRSPLAITHLLGSAGFDQDMVTDAMKTLPGLINRGSGVQEVLNDAEALNEG